MRAKGLLGVDSNPSVPGAKADELRGAPGVRHAPRLGMDIRLTVHRS